MTASRVTASPKRADAERNREKILQAARAAFADADEAPSMAEISRRAGVGMATLYRNFPGRRELLEALYADEVDAIVTAASDRSGSPEDALRTWLLRFAQFIASKHPIAEVLLAGPGDPRALLDGSRARVMAAGQPLLEAAQAAGEVRDELTLDQICSMVLAVGAIQGDEAFTRPIVLAALDGLRPVA